MYGIIDYETKWVICKCCQHRNDKESYVIDYQQYHYVISKRDNYISKTNWYAGVGAYKGDALIISEVQYNFLVAECEKVMEAKSLLNTTISALVGSLPKPKIDEEITSVEFKND